MKDLLNTNLCLMTDGYKLSHWLQFPEGMTKSFYYIESRGGKFDKIQTAGVHYLTYILEKGVTIAEVEEAKEIFDDYIGEGIFNYDGWMSIAKDLKGKLPIKVRSVPEGVVVPTKSVVSTFETEEGYGWLAGYLETLALRCYWYASTVATISYESKLTLQKALNDSADMTEDDMKICLSYRLHDFGARGVSSGESAAIGGLSHMYNFEGTDTLEAVQLARKLFKAKAGASIPAREHSTTTCYLREGEYSAFMNSVDNFGGGTFAVVIDSYSTKNALEWLLTNEDFLDKLTEQGGTCVLRPDSGSPIDMVMLCLNTAWKKVGGTINSKGFKVLDSRFRVIQGDGVDGEEIKRITEWAVYGNKFSQENFLYGMGGGLLQHCDRDWGRWAMKCSAMEVNGEWRGVFKSPETDPTKTSKAGRLDLVLEEGVYVNKVLGDTEDSFDNTAMVTVFDSGERLNLLTLDEIRNNS